MGHPVLTLSATCFLRILSQMRMSFMEPSLVEMRSSSLPQEKRAPISILLLAQSERALTERAEAINFLRSNELPRPFVRSFVSLFLLSIQSLDRIYMPFLRLSPSPLSLSLPLEMHERVSIYSIARAVPGTARTLARVSGVEVSTICSSRFWGHVFFASFFSSFT